MKPCKKCGLDARDAMRITPKQYAIMLYEVTKVAEKSALTKAVRGFIELLTRNRAMALLPRIERAYVDYYNAQEEVLDVEITSARELSHHTIKNLKSALKDHNVECVAYIDEGVLGGARIRAGDYMIDDTLKARLQMLKQFLIQ